MLPSDLENVPKIEEEPKDEQDEEMADLFGNDDDAEGDKPDGQVHFRSLGVFRVHRCFLSLLGVLLLWSLRDKILIDYLLLKENTAKLWNMRRKTESRMSWKSKKQT